MSSAVITPIVFWPSFAPCVNEKKVEEKTCNLPNILLTLTDVDLWNPSMMATVKAAAIANPTDGDTTINISTASMPGKIIPCNPPAIKADPTRPPINAWLLDDGRPNHQVMRSQIIPPISPARITFTVENSGCIIPFPTVAATAVPSTNGPAKFAVAAIETACNGLRTRVPTTVAMEFAASWKPLTKSKNNAATIAP
jgi:hypothetical protein